MTAASRPVRKLLPTLVLVLGSILFSLAVGEVALRAAGFEVRQATGDAGFESWAVPDPELGWVNRAGTWKSAEPGNLPMTFEADGQLIFFKIDYFDKALNAHSPDPSDPAVTERVITIMLAEEY